MSLAGAASAGILGPFRSAGAASAGFSGPFRLAGAALTGIFRSAEAALTGIFRSAGAALTGIFRSAGAALTGIWAPFRSLSAGPALTGISAPLGSAGAVCWGLGSLGSASPLASGWFWGSVGDACSISEAQGVSASRVSGICWVLTFGEATGGGLDTCEPVCDECHEEPRDRACGFSSLGFRG